MQLTIPDATELAVRVLLRHGMTPASARVVADHLVDANLCGHEFSGLPRLLAIVDELDAKAPPRDIRLVHEAPGSALIDGGDNIAYVVTITAIDKAVEICRSNGLALVCANNTWFSGRLGYYVERAARQGYIAMHTTNTTARVAPFGGIDRIMGTNPFAIAFPSDDEPLIIDIATASTSWGDVLLSKAKGEPLSGEVAVDREGRPTTDPDAALAGAFLPWGGVRGSALSMAVQLLGIFAGSANVIHDTNNWGLFFLLADPDALMPGTQFKTRVSEFRRTVAASRPAPGDDPVHVAGDGSLERRRRGLEAGVITVDDKVYARLVGLAA